MRRLLGEGRMRVVHGLRHESGIIPDLMDEYASAPMCVANACPVRMTETLPNTLIVTAERLSKSTTAATAKSSPA